MIRRCKAKEAAQIIGMEIHLLKPLSDYGFLTRTKAGHGYLYDTEELENFIRITRGFDLSNEYAIKLASQIIQPQKKAVSSGFDTATSAA